MKTILIALAVTSGTLAATAADFALAFDGTNDYVRVASAPELTLSNRFTLEFWFKPATTNQSNTYLLSHSPSLRVTNVAGLGGRQVSFSMPASALGTFSVEVSTNVLDWEFLAPATPQYGFTDTNAPAAPQRYYRLRWP